MSPQTPRKNAVRARRDRVLVVGDDRRTDAALTSSRPVERVADIYAALGEVTIAEEPFAIVLVDHAAVDGAAARAADALRRIDPAVRVVLLTDAESPDGEAYDECVRIPDDLPRLASLLQGGASAAATESTTPASPPSPVAADEPASEPRDRPARGAFPETTTPAPSDPPAPPAQPAPPAPADQPAPVGVETPAPRRPDLPDRPVPDRPERADSPVELGDVDLIERLLRGGASLLETALRLIVQETGWTDTRLSVDATAEASGTPAAQAEVSYDGRRFGWLRTNLAPREAVEPWARWLARWLALEQTHRDYRLMAYQDDLTGSWNRRFFDAFLNDTLELARRKRRPVTVMVFDIDNFKLYNDRFGHHAGDTVLIETVRLLTSVIRKGDRVCRVGGDEFAVIFADLEGPREAGSTHPATPELIAQRFQDQIGQMRFPKLGAEAPGNLSISAGLATFPWDGLTPQELADCADRRALQSKQRGKNSITLGPGTEAS